MLTAHTLQSMSGYVLCLHNAQADIAQQTSTKSTWQRCHAGLEPARCACMQKVSCSSQGNAPVQIRTAKAEVLYDYKVSIFLSKAAVTALTCKGGMSGPRHTSFCGKRKRRSSVLVPTKLAGTAMSVSRAVAQECGMSSRFIQLYISSTLPCNQGCVVSERALLMRAVVRLPVSCKYRRYSSSSVTSPDSCNLCQPKLWRIHDPLSDATPLVLHSLSAISCSSQSKLLHAYR